MFTIMYIDVLKLYYVHTISSEEITNEVHPAITCSHIRDYCYLVAIIYGAFSKIYISFALITAT
jgi:hypothetical protein